MFKIASSIMLTMALVPAPLLAQQGVPAASTIQPTPATAIGPPQPGAPSAGSAASYVLDAGDEIEMTVFGQTDMTLKARIKGDGTIIAPFLGPVKASGRTAAQLSQDLSQAYIRGGYLSNPSVNVEVTTYGSKTVTVLGAVPNAGLYALDKPYTIAAMLARAGGSRIDGANAVILTPGDGTAPVRISLADVGGAAARQLQPGDTLFVPAAEMVYVYGEVNKGGTFAYRPGLTYRQALAMAGGPTLAGSTKRIEVRRGGKKIAATLDDISQPEDVLVIREKLF